jgi:hypothetical protein
MGCKGSKPKLVQLGIVKRTKPAAMRGSDFYCADCGFSMQNAPENLAHTCRVAALPQWAIDRQSICDGCSQNVDDVCQVYKQLHPDRDAVVSVGAKMPLAKCPLGKWQKQAHRCSICSRITYGEQSCRYCREQLERDTHNVTSQGVYVPSRFTYAVKHKQSKLAIVTMAVGKQSLELAAITLPRLRDYADACGADLHVITQDECPGYPLANKFAAKNIVAAYERTAWIDIDAWVHDLESNIFDAHEPGHVHMHRDLPHSSIPDGLKGELTSVKQSQRNSHPLTYHCLNTGVVVLDRKHAAIYDPPVYRVPTHHLSEQTWIEIQTQLKRTHVKPMETIWNTQFWLKDFWDRVPSAKIIHFASCPHDQRLKLLTELRDAYL